MKEKTKRFLLVAGLTVIGILLATGISVRLYREEKREIPASTEENIGTEEVVEIKPEIVPTTEMDIEELVIETEVQTDVRVNEQELQSDPVKTEDEKPTEAPEVRESAEVENPNVEPEYKDGTTTPQTDSGTQPTADNSPKTGDMKDGYMYIEGFGWVEDQGGGGEGIYAEDMYENGNKIGIMD